MQQSELALFAEDFERALAPLAGALAAAARSLRSAGDELPFDAADFHEACGGLERELAALRERVAKERATVFVFGPAKSGKSTLLDALAGAPAGAVSSLPSYPCVARVRHAARESAGLLRFDGGAEEHDPAGLALQLQRAHHELAARARAALVAGEVFDPARHFPRAVRRIERSRAAELLARGALELVECPPIHGPLFPTYSEMLIGEPDHARAGVFVVRAGQLCDDAVFDGIEELLATFERLILVLNLDEGARELTSAGELAASPERDDPARLIAAFEEHSTSASIVEAVRAGRVPVLALDLIEAARARRHGGEEPAAPGRSRARFQDLLAELARVLDAHEALEALVRSALRRAEELEHEARELAAAPGLAELRARHAAAERERAGLENLRLALGRLAARGRERWEREEFFESLRVRLAARTAARARELALELEAPLARALEDWFARAGSLAELVSAGLEPRLAAALAELARSAERALREELGRAVDPALLSAPARAELDEARVELAALLASSAEGARVNGDPPRLRPLDVQAIPVRAKLGQRLTWRGADQVRRAFFGPPEAPAAPLASHEKARQLGDEARAAMLRSAVERARAILAEEAQRCVRVLVEGLITAFAAEVERHAAREGVRLGDALAAATTRAHGLAGLADALAALAPSSARARTGLAELAERRGSAGVLVPAPRARQEESVSRSARLQPGSSPLTFAD